MQIVCILIHPILSLRADWRSFQNVSVSRNGNGAINTLN